MTIYCYILLCTEYIQVLDMNDRVLCTGTPYTDPSLLPGTVLHGLI